VGVVLEPAERVGIRTGALMVVVVGWVCGGAKRWERPLGDTGSAMRTDSMGDGKAFASMGSVAAVQGIKSPLLDLARGEPPGAA